MKDKILIAILYNQNISLEKILYSINTAINQTYENIDLLVLGNRIPEFQFDEIVEAIRSNKNANVKNIDFYFPKYYCCYTQLIKYIFDYMEKQRDKYVYILTNGNAFYQQTVIKELADGLQENEVVLLSNSVNYDENDVYVGEFTRGEELSIDLLSEMICTYLTEEVHDNWKVSGLLRGDTLKCITEENFREIVPIRYIPGIYGLRYMKVSIPCTQVEGIENSVLDLNCSEQKFVKKLLNIMIWRKLNAEEILHLKRIQKSFVYNTSKIWGEKLNAKWFVPFIDEVLSTNERIFRFHLLWKYRNIYLKRKELKVVFFCHQYQLWSSLKSVYESFSRMPYVNAELVYVEEFHMNSNQENVKSGIVDYENAGLDIVSYKEYRLRDDNPDVAVFVSPYSFVPSGFAIDEIAKIVPRCVYIPYGFMFESELEEFVRLRYRIAMMYLGWKVICDDRFNVELGEKYAYSHGDNFVAWGNPRTDALEELPLDEDQKYITELKKRANGRKTVLWNVHHSISDSEDTFSTWTKYGMQIIEYISLHKELYFVWRPHPLFWNALKTYVGEEQYAQFIKRIEKIENLYIDTYKSYLAGFYVADIFLTDASSLAKEFVFMEKPVIVTLWDERNIINPDLKECFYMPKNMEELEMIMNELSDGLDVTYEKRVQYVKANMKKKCVGEYIKEMILTELESELSCLEL